MRTILYFGGVVCLAWLGSAARAQQVNPTPPGLSVRSLANQSVRLAWPKEAAGFVLEQTDRLNPSPAWQLVAEQPLVEGEEFAVTITAGDDSRFFRLREGSLRPDGDEDDDGLLNSDEIARGTSPFLADTDGDGWSDGVEVADGTGPLDPNSSPRVYFVGRPPLDVVLPSFDEIGTTGTGITMGSPGVELVFPSLDEVDSRSGLTIGRPSVDVVFPGLEEVDSRSGVTIGRPPLEVVFPALDEIDSILTGITLGRPPISIRYIP